MSIANFPQPGPGWESTNPNIFTSTSPRVPTSSTLTADAKNSSNTARNKTDQRGVLQFVAIHQTVGDEKLWKHHFRHPLFRIIDPHDSDHLNFLVMQNELVQNAFNSIVNARDDPTDMYNTGRVDNLRHGTYPYGRYQTVPQLNYTLAKAQLEEGVPLTYKDVWARIRPSGVPHATPANTDFSDGMVGDVRPTTITGPVTIYNVFGKNIEPGWQFGVLIVPVPVQEGKEFKYRVTPNGPIHPMPVSSCLPNNNSNKACQRGYIWQLKFYCCPGQPSLSEYYCSTTSMTVPPVPTYMTGGYMRLGRIHYEFDESRNFFAPQNETASMLLTCSTDMGLCENKSLVSVFWDIHNQKFH